MPDLTPPPMSDLFILGESHWEWEAEAAISFARAIEAHVNEQWRQRLEQVGTTDLDGNLLTLKALPYGTPLYRIKEQG